MFALIFFCSLVFHFIMKIFQPLFRIFLFLKTNVKKEEMSIYIYIYIYVSSQENLNYICD